MHVCRTFQVVSDLPIEADAAAVAQHIKFLNSSVLLLFFISRILNESKYSHLELDMGRLLSYGSARQHHLTAG